MKYGYEVKRMKKICLILVRDLIIHNLKSSKTWAKLILKIETI